MTTPAETAKGLSTEEWAALEYIQTNGSYLINDEDNSLNNFDRVFLKGLLNKIYNQDSPRYFLNVYGNAVLETRASAPVAGKPAEITAREFVEQGYAEKIAKGECVVLCHATNEVTDIQLSGDSGTLYYKWFGEFETRNGFESVRSIDVFQVEWVKELMPAPQPATAQAANDALPPKGEFEHLYDDPEAFGQALADKHMGMVKDAVDEWAAKQAANETAEGSMTPITHRNREIERLERELAESRKECKRLREAEKFVRSLESCSYSEHSDYVKARELELWQDRAEELVAEWDETLAPKVEDK